jgi:hypothetical protein
MAGLLEHALVRCAGCAAAVADPVHCTLCGAHFHPACAPRVATDAAFDGVLRMFASGLNASLLRARRTPAGPIATVLALAAVATAVWGRSTREQMAVNRLPSGADAVRFAKEAARLDDAYDALAAELELLGLPVHRVAGGKPEEDAR